MPASSTDAIATYITKVDEAYRQGDATEHTYRTALEVLLNGIVPGVRATNEPRRTKVGAPDYIVTRRTNFGPLTVGYVEAKDIDNPLKLEEIERDGRRANPSTREGRQLKRYLEAFPNMLFTDYLNFRWYVNGELRDSARLAAVGSGGKIERDQAQAAVQIISSFLDKQVEPITSARELATRMARLTHLIRDMIVAAFQEGLASDLLLGWREAFAKVLISDLNEPEKTGDFADMFAQTLAYGLFSARIMDDSPQDFSRREAQDLIPRTNPFLREVFEQISGNRMVEEPYAPYVDDLAELLRYADMERVLQDFGKKTRQEDPVVHFYETFLAAYDPKLREARGVYYTPEPVVSYIVRSVDHLLKTRFKLRGGLADSGTIRMESPDPWTETKALGVHKTTELHKVLVLDPACGTGTFLYAIVSHIREQMMARGNAGMWSVYVRDHLLPRLFGFELLMAPYAVAHFKLAFQLRGLDLPPAQRDDWSYDFESGERIGVFLTNTLDKPHERAGLPPFIQRVADESNGASHIKQVLPIMVVLGNPPYSGHSANNSDWIAELLRDYYHVDGKPLGERNPKWLQDDYVKFIRFGQWRIDLSGSGILAFISNNAYLENPTFRGMRQSLLDSFSEIYIFNLHGDSKKAEMSPDGSIDENVFDIRQGVAIAFFIKQAGSEGRAKVYYADLWGPRDNRGNSDGKYQTLASTDVSSTEWRELLPRAPFYMYIPQDTTLSSEYEQGYSVTDIFPTHSMGITTGNDKFVTAISREELEKRMADLASKVDTEQLRMMYDLKDSSSFSLEDARFFARYEKAKESIIPIAYRCFDMRYIIYSARVLARAREEVSEHLRKRDNRALVTFRAIRELPWAHVMAANAPVAKEYISSLDNCFAFPLYLYEPLTGVARAAALHWLPGLGGRRPNLSPAFVAEMEQRLGIHFVPDGKGDRNATFGPEDVFDYIYAMFHSPTYRERYAQFLKMDFPRVPLTSNVALFRRLCEFGGELGARHLLEAHAESTTRFPQKGDTRVEQVRYTEPGQGTEQGRVYINKTQYFEGVAPQVWEFQIGGYQVAQKWLKDRKGRKLTFDDLNHYQKVLAALQETMRIMREIDEAIPGWPIE